MVPFLPKAFAGTKPSIEFNAFNPINAFQILIASKDASGTYHPNGRHAGLCVNGPVGTRGTVSHVGLDGSVGMLGSDAPNRILDSDACI